MRIELKALLTLRGKLFIVTSLLFLLNMPVRATHIVGAEIWYECLNAATNNYDMNLRMLRDCTPGRPAFEDSIYLFVFQSNDPTQVQTLVTYLEGPPQFVPATTWGQCVGNTTPRCIEEATYSRNITLPPIPGGYDIAWARCCRNAIISNLFVPEDQGVTFLTHIPGPEDAICNTSPTFNDILPSFLCVGEDFYFDHSATDPDGDSLVYRLTRPYDGLNLAGFGAGNDNPGNNPPIVEPSNPMGPPPYRNVVYSSPGFNELNPFGPGSAYIDPGTGLLRFSAPQIGIYVVAISVFEYRNGVLLSENKRDLQIDVVQCLPQNDPPVVTHTFSPTDVVSGDTLILNAIDTTCYTVTVEDTNGNPVQAQPISVIFGGPDAPTVTTTGTNPLELDICWDSDCDFAGSTIELIIMGWDDANCPIHNPAFDTVYIRIEPPEDAFPAVNHQLPPGNPGGPDTLIVEYNTQACWTAWALDTLNRPGPLDVNYFFEEVGGVPGGVTPILNVDSSDPDSIALDFCWTPGCDNIEKLYRLLVQGVLTNECPPNNNSWDTMYIYIPPIPNPPPVVRTDLSGNIFSNDTIFVDVHDSLCFRFVVNDTFPANSLSYGFTFTGTDGMPPGGLVPTFTQVSNQDSLVLDVCWYPTCPNVDRILRLEMGGIQDNNCDQEATTRDTVYFVVNDVVNPPPTLTHSFLPGFNVNGDTIIVPADSLACFEFALRDSGMNTFLDLEVYTELLATNDSAFHNLSVTVTDSSDTLLAGEICFVPGCDFLDQTLSVIMIGRDTFDCSPANWVYDTVYVRAIEPLNDPPVIQHFLGNLPVVGGVVEVVPNGEPYCYTIELSDPDSTFANLSAEGTSYVFDTWFRYGNPAEVTVTGTNPLLITVCWDPSCYDSGEEFDLVVCGQDSSRCVLSDQVCDTVRFRVMDCNIEVQNVFTPNGDGINDDFIPFHQAGVEYYRLQIFDRWGKEVYQGDNQRWDGSKGGNGGKQMPEGVYYYIFEYQFYSARGVPLKERSVGNVTLMR